MTHKKANLDPLEYRKSWIIAHNTILKISKFIPFLKTYYKKQIKKHKCV
jgi:hypothetical protein